MQPLHIFEPRYCEMLLDAMANDQLITMATLVGGVADLMTKRPQIAPYVCIGRVVSHAQAEDGTHNILLVGARRGMIVREMESMRPFRMAQVEVQDDIVPVVKPTEREKLRRLLLEALPRDSCDGNGEAKFARIDGQQNGTGSNHRHYRSHARAHPSGQTTITCRTQC